MALRFGVSRVVRRPARAGCSCAAQQQSVRPKAPAPLRDPWNGSWRWGKEKQGPIPQHAILEQLAARTISFDDLVWRDGFQEWRPLRSVFPREARAEEKKRQKEEARRKKEEARKRRPVIPPEQQSYSVLAVASVIFAVLLGGVAVGLSVAKVGGAVGLILGGVASAVGVILGFLGLYDIGTSNGYHKGLPFAIAGILLGLLGAAITLLISFN